MADQFTFSNDFDGDGVVYRADVRGSPPAVRVTLNSGQHVTTFELDAADLGNFAHLIETARKDAMAALAITNREA